MRNRATHSKDGVKDAQSNHSLERWANPTLARERSVLLRGSLGVAERGPSNVAAGGWVRRARMFECWQRLRSETPRGPRVERAESNGAGGLGRIPVERGRKSNAAAVGAEGCERGSARCPDKTQTNGQESCERECAQTARPPLEMACTPNP